MEMQAESERGSGRKIFMDPYKFEVCDIRGRIAPIATGPFAAGGLDDRGVVPDGCSWEEVWRIFCIVDPECKNAIMAAMESGYYQRQ